MEAELVIFEDDKLFITLTKHRKAFALVIAEHSRKVPITVPIHKKDCLSIAHFLLKELS
jgi:hypothetical protein